MLAAEVARRVEREAEKARLLGVEAEGGWGFIFGEWCGVGEMGMMLDVPTCFMLGS